MKKVHCLWPRKYSVKWYHLTLFQLIILSDIATHKSPFIPLKNIFGYVSIYQSLHSGSCLLSGLDIKKINTVYFSLDNYSLICTVFHKTCFIYQEKERCSVSQAWRHWYTALHQLVEIILGHTVFFIGIHCWRR